MEARCLMKLSSDKYLCTKCGHITKEKPKFCPECGYRYTQLIRTCECGREFHPETSKRRYCSVECGLKYKKKGGKKGKHYPNNQRAAKRICVVCGKEFRAVKDDKKRHQKYCSKDCWNHRARKINHCLYCGKEIITMESVDKKYCCEKCRAEDYKRRFKGDKSPQWKGGRTSEWKCILSSAEYKEWRQRVFQRDGYTCRWCGSKKNIEAHHIKGKAAHPELMFDVDNGLTLCHECHRLTDNYGSKAIKEIADGSKTPYSEIKKD